MVEDLEKKGIISKASSPWNFPLVIVKKKDNGIRLCVDYRKLNSVTSRPIYPIPSSRHLFDSLSGAKYFSAIDLSMGYHQVLVDEKDRQKTAFTTKSGQYQFNRLPFGLCGAPATFQRVMSSILREQNWNSCVIYLDDVLIFGRTPKEHNERLTEILNVLQRNNVKLSPKKCTLL